MNTKQTQRPSLDARAAAIMRRAVTTINQSATVSELVSTLVDKRILGVPVVDNEGDVVGIVSMTDVLREQRATLDDPLGPFRRGYVPEGGLWQDYKPADGVMSELRVYDIMSSGLITAPPEATLPELARRMVENKVHRLIIADDGGMLGLVTGTDILAALARSGDESDDSQD